MVAQQGDQGNPLLRGLLGGADHRRGLGDVMADMEADADEDR